MAVLALMDVVNLPVPMVKPAYAKGAGFRSTATMSMLLVDGYLT